MAHLLSSTISRGMLETSWRKKNVSKAIKHKDTICGSGSPWTANHKKLGKYISKVSLHTGPTLSCCCLQLDADLHGSRKMFLCSQVARGKSSSTFIINCIYWGSIWKTEGGTPTIYLVEPLLQVPLQLPECQRTDRWHQWTSSRTTVSLYECLPIKFKVVPFHMTCLLEREWWQWEEGHKPNHSVRGKATKDPQSPLV